MAPKSGHDYPQNSVLWMYIIQWNISPLLIKTVTAVPRVRKLVSNVYELFLKKKKIKATFGTPDI